jgi:fatty acid desaturase
VSRNRVFRFSGWDVLNVAIIPFQIAFYLALAYAYPRLSPLVLVAIFPVLFAMSLQNAGANHNHYHTPFFRARWLNTLTSMGFSMTGAPKTPFNASHGVHHATAQSWNDESLLGILGLRRPLHKQLIGAVSFAVESFGLRYFVLLYLLRTRPVEQVAKIASPTQPELAVLVLNQIKQPETLRATKLDLAAWVAFRIALVAIDWRFFAFYFLPCTFVIEMIRQAENYFQHWGASDPEDPKRDSVSCYGTLYNLLTFNLGYHQEHHLRPGVHWRKLPRTTAELPDDRRRVPFSHYINLPVVFPRVAAELAQKRAAAQAAQAATAVGATGAAGATPAAATTGATETSAPSRGSAAEQSPEPRPDRADDRVVVS